MAGNVTGSIGNNPVELNNAATETTLIELLKTSRASNKTLLAMAEKAGVDLKILNSSIAQAAESSANENKQRQISSALLANNNQRLTMFRNSLASINTVTLELMEGTIGVSGLFTKLGSNIPIVGNLISGFASLVKILEQSMESYQKLTDVGAGFGGSLTDLRQAAANSHLTLNELQNVISKNNNLFTTLGISVTDGAKRFADINKTLIDNNRHLLAMGFTAEQLSNGLANYLTISGIRNANELSNSRKLAESAAEYMEQLDGLARLTGQSREQLQQTMKEEAQNAAWQAKLSSMSEEERKKAMQGMANALAIGGKGAVDVFQSKIMGLPPLTEEGRIFQATMSETSERLIKSADMVTDGTKNTSDMSKAAVDMILAQRTDISKFSTEQLAALRAQGGALGKVLNENNLSQLRLSGKTEEEINQIIRRAALEDEQAKRMADGMAGIRDLGAQILKAFAPVFDFLSHVVQALGKLSSGIASIMEKFGSLSTALVLVAAAATSAATAYAGFKLIKSAGSGSVLDGLTGGSDSGGGGKGSALTRLARGLGAFANPKILIGAGVLSGTIAILGAGFAAAVALIGLSLPGFAKALSSFDKINGDNLVSVAKGIGALGLAMASFSATSTIGQMGNIMGSVIGGISKMFGGSDLIGNVTKTVNALSPILPELTAVGTGMQTLSNGIMTYAEAIDKIDLAKAERVRELLKPQSATTDITAQSDDATTAISAITNASLATPDATNLSMLNNTMQEMLRYMRETAEYTRKTNEATRNLNGNLFA
jgi:hypothetical protein